MPRNADGPRVVLVIIDAMPHRYVDESLTPNLWRQASEGGRAPAGGVSLPVAVTYANHAAFVTGADPVHTGLHGNHVWIDGRGWVAAPKEGPRATTLFERVAAAGGRSVLVAGDQKLIGQMGGSAADVAWPPGGRLAEGTERCEFGYAADAAVVAALGSIDLDVDLAVVQLNQPDTTSHLYGPDSPEALDRYRATDAAYAKVIALLADRWPDTVVFTVSDHDQETLDAEPPVELADALDAFAGVDVVHEGTAALIHLGDRTDGPDDESLAALVRAVPGVEDVSPLAPDVWMAWTTPGRAFGATPIPIWGQHGSPRCRTQLAIVSGGSARVPELARRLERTRPSALDWAPTIARLLDLAELPA